MRSLWSGIFCTGLLLGTLVGCSNQQKSPDVTNNVRNALDQAGLKDVRVSQDRDKGVVTLTGTTSSDDQKAQAESVAKAAAGSQVIANELTVEPQNGDNTAKNVNSDLDKGIEKDVHAQLVSHKLNHVVNYHVKNGVLTLTGNVRSEAQRNQVEKLAAAVPNVKQVVNELDVKGHKATSETPGR